MLLSTGFFCSVHITNAHSNTFSLIFSPSSYSLPPHQTSPLLDWISPMDKSNSNWTLTFLQVSFFVTSFLLSLKYASKQKWSLTRLNKINVQNEEEREQTIQEMVKEFISDVEEDFSSMVANEESGWVWSKILKGKYSKTSQ